MLASGEVAAERTGEKHLATRYLAVGCRFTMYLVLFEQAVESKSMATSFHLSLHSQLHAVGNVARAAGGGHKGTRNIVGLFSIIY